MRDLRLLIKEKGLKATPSRLALLGLFDRDCSPMTVEKTISEMKGLKKGAVRISKKIPDRATVYRILENFVKAGLLKEVYFNDGVIRYESALGNDAHHHHAVCVSCGITKEVEDIGMEKIIDRVSNRIKGFSTNDHALEFFGTCDKCARLQK